MCSVCRSCFCLVGVIRGKPGGENPADQFPNAASSAAANYRAWARARTPKKFVAKLGAVNEESDEAVCWLEFVGNAALATGPELERLLQESCELRAIVASSSATARRREKARSATQAIQDQKIARSLARSPDHQI